MEFIYNVKEFFWGGNHWIYTMAISLIILAIPLIKSLPGVIKSLRKKRAKK